MNHQLALLPSMCKHWEDGLVLALWLKEISRDYYKHAGLKKTVSLLSLQTSIPFGYNRVIGKPRTSCLNVAAEIRHCLLDSIFYFSINTSFTDIIWVIVHRCNSAPGPHFRSTLFPIRIDYCIYLSIHCGEKKSFCTAVIHSAKTTYSTTHKAWT